MDRPYFLHSERIGFRCWTEKDFALAKQLWGDAQVTRLFSKEPFDDEVIASKLQDQLRQQDQFGVQYWPMFLIESGEHVGCGGLRPYRIEERIYELGFHLRPEHWGKGFASEAARVIIKHAFETVGATALFAGHHPDNNVSKTVLLKLGFKNTGTEFYEPTGLTEPSYILERAAASEAVP